MGGKRRRRTRRVHDASLVQRLFERGFLSPRQYAIAAGVRDAASDLSAVYATAQATDSRVFSGKAHGLARDGRQQSHAEAAETLARAMQMAALHPKGQKVLVAVCVEDTPCRTLDRRFGWRNGTAAGILGSILTLVWETTRTAAPAGTKPEREKGACPSA